MFSRDAKEEIARVGFERSCCPRTFVRALERFSARDITKRHARLITSERGPVIRAVISAAHRAGIGASVFGSPQARAGKRRSVVITGQDAATFSSCVPGKACCRRAWLRAAFLSCGSVSDPKRAYHLEFLCRNDAAARLVCAAIAALHIDAGISRRRGRPVVYVKNAQGVSMLLAHLGANSAVLQLEAQRALRQTKNAIRCAVNGETANAARSASVAARQHKAAERMLRRAAFGRVSASVKEAAKLRIAHPDGTLAELAQFARPPITKAAMASRLRLLERIAKR